MLHRFIDPETDAASQKAGTFSAPRYYGARQARAERDRGLKRVRLGHAQEEPHSKLQKGPTKLALPLPGFIPLDESDSKVNMLATLVAEALTMQMLVVAASLQSVQLTQGKVAGIVRRAMCICSMELKQACSSSSSDSTNFQVAASSAGTRRQQPATQIFPVL